LSIQRIGPPCSGERGMSEEGPFFDEKDPEDKFTLNMFFLYYFYIII
jgi:hypothetical protein